MKKMGISSISTELSNNTKVAALETSLQESFARFKDLVIDFQQLSVDSENYKLQYLSAKEKCESKTCAGAEELQKIITSKDHIIQAVASTLTKLNETKDLNILTEVFKLLFEEVSPLTPPTEIPSPENWPSSNSNKADNSINKNNTPESHIDDVSFKEESMSEIEGTPTGRTSPIIPTRKTTKSILAKSEVREKKKCPDEWPTSEPKAIRLVYPIPRTSTPKGTGRLRQSRLNLVTKKTTTVVDLTCSPEVAAQKQEQLVQPLIKKESVEDDTILPSPTSGPTNFIFKTTVKASPSKFKKPKPLSLKARCENARQDENKDITTGISNVMDESINILNQFNRIRDVKKENSVHKNSPVKKENFSPIKIEKNTPIKKEMESVNLNVIDEDATNASISIQDIEQIEEHIQMQNSPSKRPLAENINIVNTPPKHDIESSLSILRPEPAPAAVDAVKKRIPELVEPVYKEPAVRNKAEKRNLQGWSCEECMNFYGSLYKDDPVMLAKKIQDCSKHRGRHNPARPKTPPNFWNPRWTVPDDTEELNRMNNAD